MVQEGSGSGIFLPKILRINMSLMNPALFLRTDLNADEWERYLNDLRFGRVANPANFERGKGWFCIDRDFRLI